MPSLPDEVLNSLEAIYGPVALNFTLTQTPQGDAPDHIKEQWVDLALPVRERNLGKLATYYLDFLSGEFKENEEPIHVTGIDAVHALNEAERTEAAEFWAPYQLGLFTFRAYEGILQALE